MPGVPGVPGVPVGPGMPGGAGSPPGLGMPPGLGSPELLEELELDGGVGTEGVGSEVTGAHAAAIRLQVRIASGRTLSSQ
ncbi:MAG: hypothetical protein H6993_12750 [Pseudomonadales bacterium]|nr:hypothetical protein [Pseudomonadales bacterium]MCP5184827.1 hypothetical protein [Pseudomonadales bacterium]